MLVILLAATALPFAAADVIKTVYCKAQCNDYLTISESHMTVCGDDVSSMLFCGTVISCNPNDALKMLIRPRRNHTEAACCYVTQIKEHGDCDPREVVDTLQPVIVKEPPPQRIVCQSDAGLTGWIVSCALLFVVLLETAYILHTFLTRPQAKIAQLAPLGHPLLNNARPVHPSRNLLCEP